MKSRVPTLNAIEPLVDFLPEEDRTAAFVMLSAAMMAAQHMSVAEQRLVLPIALRGVDRGISAAPIPFANALVSWITEVDIQKRFRANPSPTFPADLWFEFHDAHQELFVS